MRLYVYVRLWYPHSARPGYECHAHQSANLSIFHSDGKFSLIQRRRRLRFVSDSGCVSSFLFFYSFCFSFSVRCTLGWVEVGFSLNSNRMKIIIYFCFVRLKFSVFLVCSFLSFHVSLQQIKENLWRENYFYFIRIYILALWLYVCLFHSI